MKLGRRWNLLGLACGLAAAGLLVLWVVGPWYVNVGAASKGGHLSAWLINGDLDLIYSSTPSRIVAYYATNTTTPLVGVGAEPEAFAGKVSIPGFATRPWILGQWAHDGNREWILPWVDCDWQAGDFRSMLPLWSLAVPFAAVGVFTEGRYRRRLARERIGKCAKCGYDRVGISQDVACPECGKKP